MPLWVVVLDRFEVLKMLLFRLHAWWGIESWGTECVQEIIGVPAYPFGKYPRPIVKNIPAGLWSRYYCYLHVAAMSWWRMVGTLERYEWAKREIETLDRLWPDVEVMSEFVCPYRGFLILRPKVVVGHGPWLERFERPKYLLVYREKFWEARERKTEAGSGRLFEQGEYLGSSRYLVRRPPLATTTVGDDWFHMHVKYWHYPTKDRCRVRVLWRSAAEFIGSLERVGVYTFRLREDGVEEEKVLQRGVR